MLERLIELLNLDSGTFMSVYFGNTAGEYVAVVIVLVAIVALLKLVEVIILARLSALSKRTKTDLDDVIVQMIGTINPPLYLFVALYVSVRALSVNSFLQQSLDFVLIVWLTYQAIIIAQVAIDYVLKKSTKSIARENKSAIKFLSNIFRFILWVIGLLVILQNIGIDVTALVAGFGIGGIAIALAIQNILGDLFSSFSIVFDKPFIVGDFIKASGVSGTVEKIGIKTTRLRSSDGEEIVLSNSELTNAKIQNFGRLEERRMKLEFGILYETPNEKMEQIPPLVEKIISDISGARFNRAHFTKFNDSSLDYEVTYYVESSEYGKALDIQQKINLRLKIEFEKRDVGMAYPTRTVYMSK